MAEFSLQTVMILPHKPYSVGICHALSRPEMGEQPSSLLLKASRFSTTYPLNMSYENFPPAPHREYSSSVTSEAPPILISKPRRSQSPHAAKLLPVNATSPLTAWTRSVARHPSLAVSNGLEEGQTPSPQTQTTMLGSSS